MLTSRALKGAGWRFTWVFLKSTLQIALVIVLARFIRPEDFGIAATVALVQKPFSLVCTMSLDAAIIQRKNLTQSHAQVAFTLSLLASLIAVTILLGIASPCAIFFDMPELEMALKVSTLSFLLGRLSSIPRALLERELRFKRLLAVDTSSQMIGYTLPSIYFAIEGYGFWALIIGSILRNAIRCAIFPFLFSTKRNYRFSLAKSEMEELLSFGKGLTIGRVFHTIALRGDYFIVGRVLGAGDLGLYTRAYKLMDLPGKLFVQIFDKVMFPTMSKIQHDDLTLLRIYYRSIGSIALFLLPLSAFSIVLTPEIILFTLGNQWLDIVTPLKVLFVGTFARESLRISDSILRAKGVTYRSAYRKALFAFLVVVGSAFGVRYGISGVAISAVVSLSLTAVMIVNLTLTVLKGKWFEYIGQALPGIALSVLVAFLTQVSASILHSSQAAIPTTIIVSFTTNILAVLLFSHICPSIFGETGFWMTSVLKDSKYIKRFFCWKKRIF